MAATQQSVGRQIRLTSELDNAFGQLIGMGLLLIGMLEELALHAEGTDPCGRKIMAPIAENAHDFGSQGLIQQVDNRLYLGLVSRCHGAVLNPLSCPGPERLHIGQTDGFFYDSFSFGYPRRCCFMLPGCRCSFFHDIPPFEECPRFYLTSEPSQTAFLSSTGPCNCWLIDLQPLLH